MMTLATSRDGTCIIFGLYDFFLFTIIKEGYRDKRKGERKEKGRGDGKKGRKG